MNISELLVIYALQPLNIGNMINLSQEAYPMFS